MKTEGQENMLKVEEKCRAVLAIWTERRKGSDVSREMGITRNLLSQWQERAMEGMLEALEPRGRRELVAGPALGNKVKKLLEKKARQRESGCMPKMEKKLIKLQEGKLEATA